MSDANGREPEDAVDVLDRYLWRAERIGRLAAVEKPAHDEAHRIASATAVLASIDYGRHAARARLRRSPFIHAVLAAIILLQFGAALSPDGRGFTLLSLATILYMGVHVAELTVGNPVHRVAARLPGPVQRLVSPHFFAFEHAVLSAYTEECRSLGHPGCTCVTTTADE